MQRTGKGELEKDIVNGREREEVTKWLSEVEKRKKDEDGWIMKEGKRIKKLVQVNKIISICVHIVIRYSR